MTRLAISSWDQWVQTGAQTNLVTIQNVVTKMLTLAVVLLMSPTGSFQKYEVEFDVSSIGASGQSREVGTSRWTSMIGERGRRNITWTYESLDKSSSWRRDFSYDSDGSINYQSYEVGFGDLKTRWFLSRGKEGWELTGRPAESGPKPSVRFHDESVFWFRTKRVKPGAKVSLAFVDEVTFGVRRGTAEYRRDEQLSLGGRTVPTHLIEKKFADGSEVHYVDDLGTPIRIDMVFPSSGLNLVFLASK